jgi:hypothetical protein
VKAPPGVSDRDFVHLRQRRRLEKNKAVILDVSTEHEQALEPYAHYIRAHTYVSGGLLEPFEMKDPDTDQTVMGTLYTTITQVDLKG